MTADAPPDKTDVAADTLPEKSTDAPPEAAPDQPVTASADDRDGAARTRWRARLRSAGRAAAPALLAYLAVRAVGLIILFISARRTGTDLSWLLTGRFDANWYQQIADRGYDPALQPAPDGGFRPTNLAFFPLYPALIAALTAISPLSSAVAGLLVSWLSALAAAAAMYAIGAHLRSRATGVLLAALWGVVPHAVVQSMAYSEQLFTALAAWTLYAVLRRQWLPAGALCLLTGLARPTANAVIAAVGLAALVAIVRRRDGWRPWVAAALAPLGYLGYLAWLAQHLGRPDAYFHLQREAWHITFDGGADTLRVMGEVLTGDSPLSFYMVTLVIVVAIALMLLLVLHRYPLPLVAYSLASVVFVFGAAGSYYGKGRYLMPVFTLLLPAAVGLAGARRRTQVVVLILLALVSGWYGAYLTLVWHRSP
ncbi:hypothetical protein SAMN05444365_11217 [Micromonospora pattaloongensis]|uniref:Dolichyl-phosphate-mannose-protein mannosyltransferase n=1 Tax=Micromonospora pattaloongensis TaxID=405436 RepID=A0A1H3SJL9_9ACTN|nr:hypothetical protein SAMN05444365_11217 [Micromonospora pattaloongensis]